MRRDVPGSLCRLTPCTADDQSKTNFSDIPIDIMQVIRSHVTNFKDDEEKYKFLSNLKRAEQRFI